MSEQWERHIDARQPELIQWRKGQERMLVEWVNLRLNALEATVARLEQQLEAMQMERDEARAIATSRRLDRAAAQLRNADLEQQVRDAEAKAALLDRYVADCRDETFTLSIARHMVQLAADYDALTSPDTGKCCCPDCENYCPVHQPEMYAKAHDTGSEEGHDG